MSKLFGQPIPPADMDALFHQFRQKLEYYICEVGGFQSILAYMHWSLQLVSTTEDAYIGRLYTFTSPISSCNIEKVLEKLPFSIIGGGIMSKATWSHRLSYQNSTKCFLYKDTIPVSPYMWDVHLPLEKIPEFRAQLLLQEEPLPTRHQYAYSRADQERVSSPNVVLNWR